MPRARFSKLPRAAREELLAVAARHFAEEGCERASLNAILGEAGLSKGSYYYYFEDKDDLFATVLESAFDVWLARSPLPTFEGVRARDFWSTLERFVWRWTHSFDIADDAFQAALKITDAQRKSPRFAAMLAKSKSLYESLIVPGQRLGCIRRDLPLETLVRLLEANDLVLDGLLAERSGRLTQKDLDAHVALVFDTFKRLLLAAPRRRTERRRAHG
ncbi:MAG TPA: TetR/AcrR family transcriptional regulator [Polyangiaceae bacterium]|nr:TetR/AcrR family transcriptional regulator [Polyangiaceae bacterium]